MNPAAYCVTDVSTTCQQEIEFNIKKTREVQEHGSPTFISKNNILWFYQLLCFPVKHRFQLVFSIRKYLVSAKKNPTKHCLFYDFHEYAL